MDTDLHQSCARILDEIDGGVAYAVVDLDSSTVLGSHCTSACPSGLLDGVMSAAIDLCSGPSLARIARLFGDASEPTLEHLHVASAHHCHFAKRLDTRPAAVVLVTGRTTSIGMGWAQLRASTPEIEERLRRAQHEEESTDESR